MIRSTLLIITLLFCCTNPINAQHSVGLGIGSLYYAMAAYPKPYIASTLVGSAARFQQPFAQSLNNEGWSSPVLYYDYQFRPRWHATVSYQYAEQMQQGTPYMDCANVGDGYLIDLKRKTNGHFVHLSFNWHYFQKRQVSLYFGQFTEGGFCRNNEVWTTASNDRFRIGRKRIVTNEIIPSFGVQLGIQWDVSKKLRLHYENSVRTPIVDTHLGLINRLSLSYRL